MNEEEHREIAERNARRRYRNMKENIASLKPHRCHRHIDDFYFGLSKLDITPFYGLVKCFRGIESQMVYPEAPGFIDYDFVVPGTKK